LRDLNWNKRLSSCIISTTLGRFRLQKVKEKETDGTPYVRYCWTDLRASSSFYQHSCRRVSFSCLFRFLIQVGVGDGSAGRTDCWSSAIALAANLYMISLVHIYIHGPARRWVNSAVGLAAADGSRANATGSRWTSFQLRKTMTDKGTISSRNQSSEIDKFNREFLLFFNGKRTGRIFVCNEAA
jgi:hypothetical protein